MQTLTKDPDFLRCNEVCLSKPLFVCYTVCTPVCVFEDKKITCLRFVFTLGYLTPPRTCRGTCVQQELGHLSAASHLCYANMKWFLCKTAADSRCEVCV